MRWAWTRIDVEPDGRFIVLPTQYVDEATARNQRKKLRNGFRGWRVIHETLGHKRTLIAANVRPDWTSGIVMTFVVYEKQKEA